MAQLLQDEAIGRGADRYEIQVYVKHLIQLGLHSKEMMLDALDDAAQQATLSIIGNG